jgi:hypothetical protein
LQPDYHRTYEDFVVALAEVKLAQRATTLVTPKEKAEDRGKLIHMMKISLNILHDHIVDAPTVVGFLVQGRVEAPLLEILRARAVQ